VSGAIAPGWYPDPQTAGQLRFWDGSAWTEHVQPGGTGESGESNRDAQALADVIGRLEALEASVRELEQRLDRAARGLGSPPEHG
jgi:Protein of unknown function (DUF2510)